MVVTHLLPPPPIELETFEPVVLLEAEEEPLNKELDG
jgi:hypothetical protein